MEPIDPQPILEWSIAFVERYPLVAAIVAIIYSAFLVVTTLYPERTDNEQNQ
jgi:hypothetical protein